MDLTFFLVLVSAVEDKNPEERNSIGTKVFMKRDDTWGLTYHVITSTDTFKKQRPKESIHNISSVKEHEISAVAF